MKILDIEINNFLAITHANIELADRGLVLIQGENQQDSSAQSNGSGKSSIADALCWALYGVTARGVSGNEVINDAIGKDCSVVVNIQDDGITYKIERYRQHTTNKNSLRVYSNDGIHHTDLTKGTDKLTQDVVNAIVGTSLEVFRGSIYAGQEMMPNLPAMTDKQLKVLIEEAAGIELLEKALEIARDRLKKENFTLQSINNEIDKARERIDFTERHLATLTVDKKHWLQDQADRIKSLKEKAKLSIVALRDVDDKLLIYDKSGIQNQISATNAALAAINADQDKLVKLNIACNEKNTELKQLLRDRTKLTTSIEAIKSQIADALSLVGKPCSECGQIMNEDHVHHKSKALNKRLTDQMSELSSLEKQIQSLEDNAAQLKKSADDYAKSIANPAALAEKLATLQDEMNKITAVEGQKRLLTQSATSIADQIKSLQLSVCPYDTQTEKTKAELSAANNLLVQMEKRLKSQEITCLHEQAICHIFEPSGVRARILDNVTPFLNAQTEKYLSILSDGNIQAEWTTLTKSATGALKEKFSIEVEKQHCAKSFRGLSGGEKRKVRIATALALQDLVATRATKPIELFIGDEIDDALDPAGLERLTMILEEKAKERGSVFIISHNELRDHVNQVLTVQKLVDGTTNIIEI